MVKRGALDAASFREVAQSYLLIVGKNASLEANLGGARAF